jgi:hypothetical protein
VVLGASQFSLRFFKCSFHCRGCFIQRLLMIMIILVITDRLHNHDIDDQCII